MNDKCYRLDSTYRATDCRNKSVIVWVSTKSKTLPPDQSLLLLTRNGEYYDLGIYQKELDLFLSVDREFKLPTPTHWASLEGVKPCEC